MSLYYKQKLISGVRDVPSMTLAEYNALTNKPKLWIRTDAPDSDRGINADDIEYDSNTSVKEKIDTKVSIKTKTLSFSFNNQGYVTLHDRQDIDDANKILNIKVANTAVAYLIEIYTYSLGRYAILLDPGTMTSIKTQPTVDVVVTYYE